MIVATGRRAASRGPDPARARHLPRRSRRPGRPRRPQRRRQDHPHPRPGGGGPARRGHGHPQRRRRATCRRTRAPATSSMLARDRVLSARGLDEVLRRHARDRGRHGQRGRRDPGRGDGTLRPARGGVHRPRRLRGRERGGHDLLAASGLPERVLDPAARHAVRRPAAPGRARPHPVLRRRHAAPRRADQPPGRRLDRLAARLPAGLVRAASS